MHKDATRHLLTVSQLSPGEMQQLLRSARAMREAPPGGPLAGKTVVLIFEKPSLRTRVTFEVAVHRLGGWPVLLGPAESRLGGRESIPDLASNLSQWADCLVARVFRHGDLEELSRFAGIPVVNALSDFEHPCQALADLLTLQDEWGDFRGRRLVYVGDWNNVSRSLSKACVLMGLEFGAACPEGFGPSPEEGVNWSSNLDFVAGADAVYTDVWTSMGQESEFEARRQVFAAYQVNVSLMSRAGRSALFMHCLPAHRGLEVTEAVIDSKRSLVLKQAANRLPVEMAVLSSLMETCHEKQYKESRARLFRRPRHVDHHSVAQGKLRV